MSFFLTPLQMRDRTKTVTRRSPHTWQHLEPGDRILAVRKCQGLRKGERQEPLGVIEILSVRVEPLNAITDEDVEREGFPGRTAEWFVRRYLDWNGKSDREMPVRRIAFRHLANGKPAGPARNPKQEELEL